MRAAPWIIRAFVNDMAQIIEPSRLCRLAIRQPFLTALAALPRAGGKAQNLGLDPAAFQRARQNVRADCGDGDGPPAHGTGIVDQQRDDGVLKFNVALLLIRHRRTGRDNHTRQARRVNNAVFLIEIPAAVLLRHQLAMQPVGQPGHNALQSGQLTVEIGAQPVQLLCVAQLAGLNFFVKPFGKGAIICAIANVALRAVGTHRHHAFVTFVARLSVGHFLVSGTFRLALALVFAFGGFTSHFGGLRIAFALLVLAVLLFFVLAFFLVATILAVAIIGCVGGLS